MTTTHSTKAVQTFLTADLPRVEVNTMENEIKIYQVINRSGGRTPSVQEIHISAVGGHPSYYTDIKQAQSDADYWNRYSEKDNWEVIEAIPS